MTQAEFVRGWSLLILQPWGWRYRSLTAQGEPTEESKSQLEYYYSKLSFGHPAAWMKVADLYAQGKEWPSIGELRTALSQANTHVRQSLPEPIRTYEPMPEEVKEMFAKIGKEMPA